MIALEIVIMIINLDQVVIQRDKVLVIHQEEYLNQVETLEIDKIR
jgi:hypothetical protein